MIRSAIAAAILMMLGASHAEASCTSSGFATICVDKPVMRGGYGGGGGGGRTSGGSTRRSSAPTVDRRAEDQRKASSQAASFRQNADSALSSGRYQDAINLYDKALNAYYTKANKDYYEGRKHAARQAWLDDKWNDVERAVRENRYEDLSAGLKDVQKIWFTKDLQKKIDQIDKLVAQQKDAAKRAANDRPRNEPLAPRTPSGAGGNTAFQQAGQALLENDAAAKGGNPVEAGRPYDDISGKSAAGLPAVSAASQNPVTRLAGSIGIKVDLNKPENHDVVEALNQVNYMLQYNQKAKSDEGKKAGIKVDEKAYKQRVDDLNKVLKAHGVEEVKPKAVEQKFEQFSGFSIDVAGDSKPGDAKPAETKPAEPKGGDSASGTDKGGAAAGKP